MIFTEFYSTIYKKLRQKEIKSEKIAIQACRTFEMSMQYFNLVQTDESIFTQAKNLIARFGSKHDLRTLDALHLSVYIELAQFNKVTMVSADKKLCNIAEALGYPYINPENPPDERSAFLAALES